MMSYAPFYALAADSTSLYIGGQFELLISGTEYTNVAKYNYSNDTWLPIPPVGNPGPFNTKVDVLVATNAGLYAGGTFANAGNVTNLLCF